jgi:hypothetical protein
MTTQTLIGEWFDEGKRFKATHLIVVCDTYDHEDYPVYAFSEQGARQVVAEHNGVNMQRVMEVYNLSLSKAKQLAEHRAMHF